jgi:hypothetical protein
MNKALALSLALAAAPVMAQTATPLPANVQADLALVQQDQAALTAASTQLRADQRAGNTAVAADRTVVQLARLKLRVDVQTLQIDARPIILADETVLFNALTQLHADQVAGNTAAITADEAAVTQAEEQLELDLAAIAAGMGPHHEGRRF